MIWNPSNMCIVGSKENEDFWLQVADIALDQIRVADNAQKKTGGDQ